VKVPCRRFPVEDSGAVLWRCFVPPASDYDPRVSEASEDGGRLVETRNAWAGVVSFDSLHAWNTVVAMANSARS